MDTHDEYRFRRIEDDIRELKRHEPAVIAAEVRRLNQDVADLRKHVDGKFEELEDKIAANTKTLVGFAVTVAVSAVGTVIAFILTQTGGVG